VNNSTSLVKLDGGCPTVPEICLLAVAIIYKVTAFFLRRVVREKCIISCFRIYVLKKINIEKNLNLSNWKIMHEAVTIPEEDWCESGEVLQIELFPQIKNVQVEEIKEVAIRMCESNSFDCYRKFVCSRFILFL
jgi:hypothetical protein